MASNVIFAPNLLDNYSNFYLKSVSFELRMYYPPINFNCYTCYASLTIQIFLIFYFLH